MPTVFLRARWEQLIMANYAVDPALLAPYTPRGVELDDFQGKTYVSLVGFLFTITHLFGLPLPFRFKFEEINLRFYVRRKEGNTYKRGVVFINESVPSALVAWAANRLYREHYTALPTQHSMLVSDQEQRISYQWKLQNQWNQLEVVAAKPPQEMLPGSFEEFIFEHYYGYTGDKNGLTQEYRVNHPRWRVHQVMQYSIAADFGAFYGNSFAFLNKCTPETVFLAEGSPVSSDWKRTRF
ncbi:MAG: YqjF family protein [Chitinophagaceae bacterium]